MGLYSFLVLSHLTLGLCMTCSAIVMLSVRSDILDLKFKVYTDDLDDGVNSRSSAGHKIHEFSSNRMLLCCS